MFCSAPRYMELITDMGTDVMELSGDHFADYQAVAMYETLDIYKKNNLPYYGGGYNVEDGRKPLLMEVNGNKIMFIGCNYKTIYASGYLDEPLQCLISLALGGLELCFQSVGRGAQVIPAQARRLGEGRISEMPGSAMWVRSSSARIWRSRSVAPCSNSRIMCSRSVTLRAFSSTSNRFSLSADSCVLISIP